MSEEQYNPTVNDQVRYLAIIAGQAPHVLEYLHTRGKLDRETYTDLYEQARRVADTAMKLHKHLEEQEQEKDEPALLTCPYCSGSHDARSVEQCPLNPDRHHSPAEET